MQVTVLRTLTLTLPLTLPLPLPLPLTLTWPSNSAAGVPSSAE